MGKMFSDGLLPAGGPDAIHPAMTLDIARHLDARGMRQTELAERLDISRSYMSLLVSGRREPSPGLLARMADVLGVQVADLFADPRAGRSAPGMAEPAAAPITAPGKMELAILDLARATTRHPILYSAKASAPALGILSGDTLVIDLRFTPRPGDVVLATSGDDSGAAETGLYRCAGDALLPADPAQPPIMDAGQAGVAILGLVAATFRARPRWPDRRD